MGFKNPMDFNTIHHQIYTAGVEVNSPYNDGFTSWHVKQQLYKIKWLLDDILINSPTFTDEEQFIEEHSKTTMWRILKK